MYELNVRAILAPASPAFELAAEDDNDEGEEDHDYEEGDDDGNEGEGVEAETPGGSVHLSRTTNGIDVEPRE